MHEATRAFLEKVGGRKALRCDEGTETCDAVAEMVDAALRELLDLQSAFDRAERLEEDTDLVATMGEYQQKIGALTREMQALREQAKKVERVKRELHRVHDRIGVPRLNEKDG